MSAEPTFAAARAAPGLFWLDGAGTTAGFWAGGGAPGEAPTLTQTWAVATGTYLFLGADPGDPAVFAASLAAYLAAYRPMGTPRWVWIANPAAPVEDWAATEAYTAPANPPAAGWVLARRVDFAFDPYAAVVRSGAVAPADAGAAGWGFAVADAPGAPAATFLTPAAALDARDGTTLLSMDPASAGGWRFVLDLPEPAAGGQEAFAALDCGIRYFLPDPVDGSVLPIPFTALRQPAAQALSFWATLDPLRARDGDRTHLSLFSWDGTGAGAALHTGFATARGYGVDLTPLAGGAGVPDARVVFAFAPREAGAPEGSTAVAGGLYMVPEGAFSATVLEPPIPPSARAGALDIDRLLCGVSGLEYLGLPAGATSGLVFVAGRAALAASDATATGAGALTPVGTTAWVYAQAPAGAAIRYFAQPEDAPLFGGPAPPAPPISGGGDDGDDGGGGAAAGDDPDSIGFLDFLEVSAATLPAPDGTRAFPMAPFRDLDASLLASARLLEQRALAPCRRAVVSALAGPVADPPAPSVVPAPAVAAAGGGDADDGADAYADAEAAQVGVTPQGLAVGVAEDGTTWSWVGIGQTAPGPADRPDLRFTRCDGEFRQALLTNNLFLVLGNADAFDRFGSVAYRLTEREVGIIAGSPAAADWPAELIPAVRSYFGGLGWPEYPTRQTFDAALEAAYAPMTADQKRVFRRAAGLLTPVVEGWSFRLGPDNWTNPDREGATNAYLVFKFVLGRSLAELAADLSSWGWPGAASPDGEASTAQRDILRIIAAAIPGGDPAALPPDDPYRNFAQVVTDPNWTGVLALSATVPLDTLPGPLQVLAAGIDPGAFYAHHMGMSATPYRVADGALRFDQSSLFGLIDYRNEQDQYFTSDIPFAFRVMQLTVGIRNSAISFFASRAQLLINRLFGAPTRLLPSDHGNNVVLQGAYQQQRQADGTLHDAYVFAAPTASTFITGQPVLQSVELLAVQMVTASAADPESDDDWVQGIFGMAGNLRFYEPPAFDPFCWGAAADGTDGYLRFGNMAVSMRFSLADPAGTTTFTLLDSDLSFDFANSVARPESLASRFPVRLGRMLTHPVEAPDGVPPTTPESLGFVSVSAPIDQSRMEPPWYGLVYTVDLGTLGALAGSAGISLQVLAAWTPVPGQELPAVYVGVRLPGSKDVFGVSLPLQGILNLGFRSMEFLVGEHKCPVELTVHPS